MVRIAAFALLIGMFPVAGAQAQVVFNRAGGFYHVGSGSVARYSAPFSGAAARGSGPRDFTWYSVHNGYSYAPQTGLPWRGQDLQRQRQRPSGEVGASAGGYARAFRPSRRAYYARTAPEQDDTIANARHTESLRPASRQRINPRTATAPTR